MFHQIQVRQHAAGLHQSYPGLRATQLGRVEEDQEAARKTVRRAVLPRGSCALDLAPHMVASRTEVVAGDQAQVEGDTAHILGAEAPEQTGLEARRPFSKAGLFFDFACGVVEQRFIRFHDVRPEVGGCVQLRQVREEVVKVAWQIFPVRVEHCEVPCGA